MSAVGAVAGGWLGGYAGERIGVAVTSSRGQRGLDGVLLESVAAAGGLLTGLWLLVLVAMSGTGRSRPIPTATLAAASAAVALVAVVTAGWLLELRWGSGALPVLLTLAMAVSGGTGRRLAVHPPQLASRRRQ